eukprot:245538-Pleurochrysis_carterae.AAC.1
MTRVYAKNAYTREQMICIVKTAMKSIIETPCVHPPMCTLTVAQDPHGSGKTYRLVHMPFECQNYTTFIILTKLHSAKQVAFEEFRSCLDRKHALDDVSDIKICEEKKKFIVKFVRRDKSNVMCIFATGDAFYFSIGEKDEHSLDFFQSIVRGVAKRGPSRVAEDGSFNFARNTPKLNSRCLIIKDETTLFKDWYASALFRIMLECNGDAHIAGDIEQSTLFEDNMLRALLEKFQQRQQHTEYATADETDDIVIRVEYGDEVRRFPQHLVDFRNHVMRADEDPPHGFRVRKPKAAQDVIHDNEGE